MKNVAKPLIAIKAECDSKCIICKYGLEPSRCEPWEKAVNEFLKNLPAYNMLKNIDFYYENLR